jgi:hypothetical protein
MWRMGCNLKTMLEVLCGWRLQTLIQLSGWITGGVVIQWHRRICFWFVSVFGLFCYFASYYEGSLVSWFLWWSAIPTAQWNFFMSCVNHSSAWRLARRFLGSKRMRMGGIYLMSAEECKGDFWCRKKLNS